jgi:hypothetical protein
MAKKHFGTAYSYWFTKKGIEWDQSVRYTPSQNGRTERAGGLLTLRARSFLLNANLPLDLWPEAYSTAAYILNRTPTRAGNAWTTPFQKAYGKQPMLSNLRVPSCKAYVRIPNLPKRRKNEATCLGRVGFDA